MRTRLYTVQTDPVSHEDDQGAVFLREGFSWGAALFTVLWAAWRGLWVWAAVLLVVIWASGSMMYKVEADSREYRCPPGRPSLHL